MRARPIPRTPEIANRTVKAVRGGISSTIMRAVENALDHMKANKTPMRMEVTKNRSECLTDRNRLQK